MAASWNNHKEVVKMLLSAKADVNMQNNVCDIYDCYDCNDEEYFVFFCEKN